MAFHVANESATMAPMSYDPDAETAKLFARHKQAVKTVKDTREPVLEAAEKALRQGATNPELAALTGMSDETFRKLAQKLGIDNRLKAPTVGREADARRAQAATEATEPRERSPHPSAPIRAQLPDVVAKLTDKRAAELYEQAYGWATPDQRPTLDRAAEAAPEDRDRAVVAAAYRLRLLSELDLRRN